MKRIIIWIVLFVIILFTLVLSFLIYNLRDRYPEYHVDIRIQSPGERLIKAGFSAELITPEIPDTWEDLNNDAQYNPEEGDFFHDGNGNGIFDPVWLAGFHNKRPANGIHDELWARTVVFDDDVSRISLTVVDAIGLFHDDIIEIKQSIDPAYNITYSIISSTHSHEAPDLLGLWGPEFLKSGVNQDYLSFVKKQIIQSIEKATSDLQPVKLRMSQDLNGLSHLVTDTRNPFIMDDGLRIIQFVNSISGKTIGSLIAWANHPETLWSNNLLITSDFPHYVREGIEEGIYSGDSLIIKGIGGIAIYVNGSIGGLMTTHPGLAVQNPWSGQTYTDPGFDKASAQGYQIAYQALQTMSLPSDSLEFGNIEISARTLELPLENNVFRIGAALGILKRGFSKWNHVKTEIAYVTLGPASFLTYPGEVYPELINGNIDSPQGQDFTTGPVEIPVARNMMKGNFKFIVGLGNDEIGYIIPKSQWDEKEPFTYGNEEPPYGEIISLGPDTSPILHQNIREMIELHYQKSSVIE